MNGAEERAGSAESSTNPQGDSSLVDMMQRQETACFRECLGLREGVGSGGFGRKLRSRRNRVVGSRLRFAVHSHRATQLSQQQTSMQRQEKLFRETAIASQ